MKRNGLTQGYLLESQIVAQQHLGLLGMEMIVVERIAVLADVVGSPKLIVDVERDVVGDDTSEERTERCEDLNLC